MKTADFCNSLGERGCPDDVVMSELVGAAFWEVQTQEMLAELHKCGLCQLLARHLHELCDCVRRRSANPLAYGEIDVHPDTVLSGTGCTGCTVGMRLDMGSIQPTGRAT